MPARTNQCRCGATGVGLFATPENPPRCGGTGEVACECNGQGGCACHNHGVALCPGCDDCCPTFAALPANGPEHGEMLAEIPS